MNFYLGVFLLFNNEDELSGTYSPPFDYISRK